MKALPPEIHDDPDEALLYLYFSVRFYDDHMYKVILSMTKNMALAAPDVQLLFRDAKSWQRLTADESYDKFKLNQLAFEVAIEKDYMDVGYHFIENGYV